MTAAESGLPKDTMRGWRRALYYYALSDGERPARWTSRGTNLMRWRTASKYR